MPSRWKGREQTRSVPPVLQGCMRVGHRAIDPTPHNYENITHKLKGSIGYVLLKFKPTICCEGTTLASAIVIGNSPFSPVRVTNSTSLSNRSIRTVSARLSNSVP